VSFDEVIEFGKASIGGSEGKYVTTVKVDFSADVFPGEVYLLLNSG